MKKKKYTFYLYSWYNSSKKQQTQANLHSNWEQEHLMQIFTAIGNGRHLMQIFTAIGNGST